MAIPRPGQPVRGSQSGAPIMALFDLLGRSWAMGIIWNMNDKALTFRALQDRCGAISPTILNSRIKELREAEILERTLEGYILTERGEVLRQALAPLGEWSLKWSEEVFGYIKPGMKKE